MRDLWKTSTLHSARNKQYLFSKTLCLYLGVLKISNIIGHSEEITEELKTVFIHIVPALRWGPQATQHGYFLNFTTFQGCISERLISMSTVLHALSSHQKKRSHDLLICSFYDLFFCHTSNQPAEVFLRVLTGRCVPLKIQTCCCHQVIRIPKWNNFFSCSSKCSSLPKR